MVTPPAPTVCLDLAGLAGTRTGVGIYTDGLATALARQAAPDLLLQGWRGGRVEPLDEALRREVDEAAPSVGRRLEQWAARAAPLRRLARRVRPWWPRTGPRPALFHALRYAPPRGVVAPVLPVIYDCSHRRHPECHPADRVEWLVSQERLFKAAPAIHTISAFSKREIVSLFEVSPERVHVVLAGTEPDLLALDLDDPPSLPSGLTRGRYLLAVGTLEPRKNLATLIAAYLLLPKAVQAEAPLLVIGPQGWGTVALPAGAGEAVEAGQIRFLGYLPRRDYATLLAGAAALAFPSIYEGFGLPVLEALQLGTRSAVSAGCAAEEAAAGTALALPALEAEAWRDGLLTLLSEPPTAVERRHRRALAAERFSWDRSAAQTLDLYRLALASTGKRAGP